MANKPADRAFTAKSHVGDIPAGTTFTEQQFRELHPLPDDPKRSRIDPDTYHDGLIGRLLGMGAIEVAKPDAQPTPIPDGPAAIANKQAELQKAAEQESAPAAKK